MTFPTILKHLREERELSQKDVAKYLGITRQAVAAYEVGKREPSYDVLKSLADYFSVSVDYLLGRVVCENTNASTIGKNIEAIKGSMSFKEFSDDLRGKTGAVIFPDMLEMYVKGERMPFIGVIKILSKYAGVNEGLLYSPYFRDHYAGLREKKASNENCGLVPGLLDFMDEELKNWVIQEKNLSYIKLAKEICEAGFGVSTFKPLLKSVGKQMVSQGK